MKFADITTVGGYPADEATSALQKSVRRGHEREALFWATELDLSGYGNYVFQRLRIISSEDVGLAEPLLPAVIRALYENWTEARRKKDGSTSHRLFLVHAVLLVVRAKKSRLCDHAVWVFYSGEREQIPIPDHALDLHTRRGRRMGRDLQHFIQEGARLANEAADIDDLYAAEGQAALLRAKQARPRRTGTTPPHPDQGELDGAGDLDAES